MSYFLLTNLLLNRLRAAEAGRIVTVASIAHRRAQLDFDDLQMRAPLQRADGPIARSQARQCHVRLRAGAAAGG